ncbi:hypothetical protein B566_EDAN005858 [Ephemera danica]|nr:hypothetical protein B566_EDAN005858 [Ephemera danica]
MCLAFFLPVPGCPTGYLGPGGLHDDMKYPNCTGGTAGYIDRLILPAENLFHHCTPKDLYRTGNFEPEGIYTTLPTLLSVILGMQAGATLLTFDSIRSRVYRWCVWGIACLTLASLLSFTEIIPFNKNLW